MRVVLRGSSFLATLLLAPNPTLSRGQAGSVRIGMPVEQVHLPHQDLFCEVENGFVAATRVYSPRYKTESGIGVGDRVSALANHHQIRWSGHQVIEVEELRMTFQIKEDRIHSILLT